MCEDENVYSRWKKINKENRFIKDKNVKKVCGVS